MTLVALPDDLLRNEVFRTCALRDLSAVRLTCRLLSDVPWNLVSRTVPSPPSPRIGASPPRCVVSLCRHPPLTYLVWGTTYVPWLPYCRLHVEPHRLHGIDVYCCTHRVFTDVSLDP